MNNIVKLISPFVINVMFKDLEESSGMKWSCAVEWIWNGIEIVSFCFSKTGVLAWLI